MPDFSSPLVLRGMAAAAGVAMVVGGGFLLARSGGGSGAAPGAAASSASGPRVKAPSAMGSAARAQVRYQHDGQLAYTNLVTSDANYTRASLPAGVRRQVASTPPMGHTMPQSAASTSVGTSASPAPTRATTMVPIGRLEACITAIAAGRFVMLVDEARYAGVAATIIVLRPLKGVFDVIVVGQACGASGQDVITRLTVPQK